MKNSWFFLQMIILASLFAAFPADATVYTKKDIIAINKGCVRFLKLSESQKKAELIARKLGAQNLQKYVNACRFSVNQGVERTWYLEQVYQRSRSTSRSSNRSSSRSSNSGYSSDSGTCYPLSDCIGTSTGRTNWGGSGCASGSQSFMPDTGYACVGI